MREKAGRRWSRNRARCRLRKKKAGPRCVRFGPAQEVRRASLVALSSLFFGGARETQRSRVGSSAFTRVLQRLQVLILQEEGRIPATVKMPRFNSLSLCQSTRFGRRGRPEGVPRYGTPRSGWSAGDHLLTIRYPAGTRQSARGRTRLGCQGWRRGGRAFCTFRMQFER
jgi:hypothetical protein